MSPKLYWIDAQFPGKLAVSARPRGGDWLEDEVIGWRRAGVDAVVSLLTPQENEDLQLNQEVSLSQAQGIRFISLPIEDRGVPASLAAASDALADVSEMLRKGSKVVVHCRQGIGRSGMIAGALLVASGCAADDALRLVSQTRGLPVPETSEQHNWVRQFSKKEVTRSSLARTSVK